MPALKPSPTPHNAMDGKVAVIAIEAWSGRGEKLVHLDDLSCWNIVESSLA